MSRPTPDIDSTMSLVTIQQYPLKNLKINLFDSTKIFFKKRREVRRHTFGNNVVH